MEPLGRALVVAGLVLLGLGLVLWVGPSVPWLGRLPGDIRIERPGLRVTVPITTCLLVSAVASAVLWLVSRMR